MKTRIILVASDALIITASFFVCLVWHDLGEASAWAVFPLVALVKIFLFVRYGLYNAILRFASMPFAAAILKASSLASVLAVLVVYFQNPQHTPYGFFVTDYLLTTFFVGLVRFAPRYLAESLQGRGTKRVVIYGAGGLGEEVARRIMKRPEEYKLVGFVDDNESKIGRRLHNRSQSRMIRE